MLTRPGVSRPRPRPRLQHTRPRPRPRLQFSGLRPRPRPRLNMAGFHVTRPRPRLQLTRPRPRPRLQFSGLRPRPRPRLNMAANNGVDSNDSFNWHYENIYKLRLLHWRSNNYTSWPFRAVNSTCITAHKATTCCIHFSLTSFCIGCVCAVLLLIFDICSMRSL
jgi:hypothetical protein